MEKFNPKANNLRLYTILFFAIIILICSCSPKVRLKKELFDKIELGMTKEQVKSILGEPADVRPTADSVVNYFYYIHKGFWLQDYATVEFNKSGNVSFLFYGNPD